MTEADTVLAEVRQIWRQMRALPCHERWSSTRARPSPAYLALETRMRALTDRYRTVSGGPAQAQEAPCSA
jgi:hypothetical protein